MGLIRKKPGQQIKIIPKIKMTPAQIWVSISLLFLILSGVSWFVGDLSVKATLYDKNNLFAQSELDDKIQQKENIYGDIEEEDEVVEGSCYTAEEDGLSVICGTVKSARLERKDGRVTTGGPVENAVVAVYEADPDSPTGKDEEGRLVHLFSSTTTNADGKFRIKAREVGPKERNIYVAFICDGMLAGLKRTKSTEDIPNMVAHVNCASGPLIGNLVPPAQLTYVDRGQDGGIANMLSCVTNPLKNVVEGDWNLWRNVDSPKEVAFFNEAPVTIQGTVRESDFDFRYVPLEKVDGITNYVTDLINPGYGATTLLKSERFGGSPDGAYWYNDCVVKYGADVCDVVNSESPDYLTANLLPVIPETSSAPAYRTKEIRFNFKQTNIDPISPYAYLKAVYGDVDDSGLKTQAEVAEDSSPELTRCSDLENSKKVIAEEGTLKNSKLTTGPGLGLSSPYSCEDKVEQMSDADLARPACIKDDGATLTWQEILDDQDLKDTYYRCDQLVLKGGVVHTDYVSEISDDSGESGVRGTEFGFYSGAASSPFVSETRTVIPGRQPQKVLEVAGVKDEGSENQLNVIDAPFSNGSGSGIEYQSEFLKQLSSKDKIEVWDIGTQNMPGCSVSSIMDSVLNPGGLANNLLDNIGLGGVFDRLITNAFKGVEQHVSSGIAATGTFSTEQALRRDAALVENATSDYIDSLLRAGAEGEDINISDVGFLDKADIVFNTFRNQILGSDTKSFGERGDISLKADNLNISYPLNAENFNEYFPSYNEAGYPGGHPDYPWREVSRCDVYGTSRGSLSELRTCKVTSCTVTEEEITFEDPTGRIVSREGGGSRDCTEAERELCLLQGSSGNRSCSLAEAGPYDYVGALETNFRAQIRNGSESTGEEPIAIDSLSDESADLSNAFGAPYEGEYVEKKLATLDVDYSGNESKLGKLGFDVPQASGGVPEQIYTISAAPTAGALGEPNDMYYHCNISFEGRGSVEPDQLVMPSASYVWDCYVEDTDLDADDFGICDYIDPYSLGNTGTAKPVDSLISSLKTNANWTDLITRGRGEEGWEVVRRCYGQIVRDSLQTGNDPALVLAIWIEETAASNYTAFGDTVKDFGILEGGCNGLASASDFKSQLSCFLKKQKDYQGFCPPSPLTVAEFLGVFHLGQTSTCNYSGDSTWVGQVNSAYIHTHKDWRSLDLNKALNGNTTDWSR